MKKYEVGNPKYSKCEDKWWIRNIIRDKWVENLSFYDKEEAEDMAATLNNGNTLRRNSENSQK